MSTAAPVDKVAAVLADLAAGRTYTGPPDKYRQAAVEFLIRDGCIDLETGTLTDVGRRMHAMICTGTAPEPGPVRLMEGRTPYGTPCALTAQQEKAVRIMLGLDDLGDGCADAFLNWGAGGGKSTVIATVAWYATQARKAALIGNLAMDQRHAFRTALVALVEGLTEATADLPDGPLAARLSAAVDAAARVLETTIPGEPPDPGTATVAWSGEQTAYRNSGRALKTDGVAITMRWDGQG